MSVYSKKKEKRAEETKDRRALHPPALRRVVRVVHRNVGSRLHLVQHAHLHHEQQREHHHLEEVEVEESETQQSKRGEVC
jgi:hypothetical protein